MIDLKGVGRLSLITSLEAIYFLIVGDTSAQASAWIKNTYNNSMRVSHLYFLLVANLTIVQVRQRKEKYRLTIKGVCELENCIILYKL